MRLPGLHLHTVPSDVFLVLARHFVAELELGVRCDRSFSLVAESAILARTAHILVVWSDLLGNV